MTGVYPSLIKDILHLSDILLAVLIKIFYHLSFSLIHTHICIMCSYHCCVYINIQFSSALSDSAPILPDCFSFICLSVFHFLCLSFCQLFSLFLLFPTPSLPALAFFPPSISLSFCFSLSLPTTPPTLSLSLSVSCTLCFLVSLPPPSPCFFLSCFLYLCLSLSCSPSSSLTLSRTPLHFPLSCVFSINNHSPSVSFSLLHLSNHLSPIGFNTNNYKWSAYQVT